MNKNSCTIRNKNRTQALLFHYKYKLAQFLIYF